MSHSMNRCGGVAAAGVAAFAGVSVGAATLHTDPASYQSAGGVETVLMDFDSITVPSDIGGQDLGGVQFNPRGSALIVVAGASTFTPAGLFLDTNDPANNVLTPTSGANVLSPGGSELGMSPELEYDSMEILFATPLYSLAFDLLYQSLDGASFVGFRAFDIDGNVLFDSGNVPAGFSFDGNAGGAQFYGLITDSAPIARLWIDEFDNDNNHYPDANIGIDTLRGGVPAPGFAGLLGLALTAELRRRR